jgi:hypothetical protein
LSQARMARRMCGSPSTPEMRRITGSLAVLNAFALFPH